MIILNLEWSSFPSRDRESSTLVCNYLRLQNFKVIEGCIFNALYLIFKHKPVALYMSNIVGARINFIVAKYAYSLGIPVFTTHAEGDFAEVIFGTVMGRPEKLAKIKFLVRFPSAWVRCEPR